MTKPQIEKLAQKLHKTFFDVTTLYSRTRWIAVAELAVAEVTAHLKGKKTCVHRKPPEPKSCSIVGGKRVCK